MEVETTTNRAETRASKRKREEEIEKQQKKIKRLTKAVEQLSRDLGRGIPPELDSEFESEPESDENEHVGQDPATPRTRPTTYRPSLEYDSISTVARIAKKKNKKAFVAMPLHTHWFAISLYNVYLQFQKLFSLADAPRTKTITIRNETFTVDIQAVKDASSQIEDKQGTPGRGWGMGATESLQSAETYFSATCAASLNILMKSCKNIILVHQAPIRKTLGAPDNPDAADLVGLRLGGTIRCETVFVSDLKNFDKDLSDIETALYAKFVSVNQDKPTERCLLVLGLSGTRTSATFWVYLMGNQTVWAVPIVSDVKPFDPSLIATLSIGLESLGKKPIFYSALHDPLPFNSEKVTSLKQSVNNRTFLRTVEGKKCVIKFFDTTEESVRLSNVDVMEIAGLKAELKPITNDGRISYIQYDYYNGNHKPTNLKQFYNIVCMLHKLHVRGYVHGDIREANLVFDHENCAGYLIDYDLARESGKLYPNGYFNAEIRHEDAITGLPMCMNHDRHSLAKIVERHYRDARVVIEKIRSTETLMNAAECLR